MRETLAHGAGWFTGSIAGILTAAVSVDRFPEARDTVKTGLDTIIDDEGMLDFAANATTSIGLFIGSILLTSLLAVGAYRLAGGRND